MKIYTTLDEYISQVVRPSLGEYVGDYDVRAIAEETTEWHDEIDENGNIWLNKSGFVEREDVDDVDYWDIVAKHETH